MSNRWMAAFSLLLAAVPPVSLHAADNKVDAAEAAAAMERARRQAAGPMRVILEASKVKRKVAPDPEATPAAPSTAPNRDEVAAPVAPRQPALLKLPNGLIADARTVSALPAAVDDQGLATAAPVPLPKAPSVAGVLDKPRLVEMVEPVIPQRVLVEIGRTFEVEVDETIRADGSVAALSVLPTAPRQAVRHVIAAMERWRFDSSLAERQHRVQLVFNDQ